jgi:transcriptional regulator with XRE-family HTH domain
MTFSQTLSALYTLAKEQKLTTQMLAVRAGITECQAALFFKSPEKLHLPVFMKIAQALGRPVAGFSFEPLTAHDRMRDAEEEGFNLSRWKEQNSPKAQTYEQKTIPIQSKT